MLPPDHVSHVTCHVYLKKNYKVVELVGGGSVIMGPTLSTFFGDGDGVLEG